MDDHLLFWTSVGKPGRKVGSEKTRVRGVSKDKSFDEYQESEQPYHFVLSTPSGMITADCVAIARSLIGYEIRGDDRVVAGVEVINGGWVWISPTSSQLDHDRFAAAITAQLVYREIESTAHD